MSKPTFTITVTEGENEMGPCFKEVIVKKIGEGTKTVKLDSLCALPIADSLSNVCEALSVLLGLWFSYDIPCDNPASEQEKA